MQSSIRLNDQLFFLLTFTISVKHMRFLICIISILECEFIFHAFFSDAFILIDLSLLFKDKNFTKHNKCPFCLISPDRTNGSKSIDSLKNICHKSYGL